MYNAVQKRRIFASLLSTLKVVSRLIKVRNNIKKKNLTSIISTGSSNVIKEIDIKKL